MSRPSSADHHRHHHYKHVEGDSALLRRVNGASDGCSTGEITDTSMGHSGQENAGSSETSRSHRAHAEESHAMKQSQVLPAQGSCKNDQFSHWKRSSKGSIKDEDFDCLTMPLMSIKRESQGNGCRGESRRVNSVADQMAEIYRNKLQENIDDDVKRYKKQTHSSGKGAFTSLNNEGDAKSSSKRLLSGSNERSYNKRNTYEYIHLRHNELEELLEATVCQQKNVSSRSSATAGILRCSASDDPVVAGQVTHEIEFRSQREDCVYSDRSSSKSTSVQESQDMNVVIQAVPETQAMFSRLKFYSQVLVTAPATDKNSVESDSFPSDQSVSEIQQISRSDDRATKTHHTVTASSIMATDDMKCSNETGQVSEARNHQAEVTPQYKPQEKISRETIENTIENTINPGEGALPTLESHQTDQSHCSDVTPLNVAPAAPRQMQQLHKDVGEESPITKVANEKPPSRETKSEEYNIAASSAHNLKSEYIEPQDSMVHMKCIHDKNKWVFSPQWTSGENTSETKATENNPHNKHNICQMTKSFNKEGYTAVKRTKKMKATKPLKEEHNFEAKETTGCVKRRKALLTATAGASKQGDWQESFLLNDSDTDTLDSNSCRLLQQLEMVQSCKRKANVLLKHVQDIIDGSHRPGESLTVNTGKRQRTSSKHLQKGKEPTGSHKSERKSRTKSESPERVYRKSHRLATHAKAGENSGTVEKSHKLPHETLSVDSINVNLLHTWADYTTCADGEVGDTKTTCLLEKPELLPHNHVEELHGYHKFNHFYTCEFEPKKHLKAIDTHRLLQRQTAARGDKCSAPYSEFELKSPEFCGLDNQPAGQENYADTQKFSHRESPDRKHSPTKCGHWISSAALGETWTATHYYEKLSNTSASSNSFFVCNDVDSAIYNSMDFCAKDDEYYDLLEKRSRNSFARSRSVNPHISRRECGLDYQHKISNAGKKYKVSRASMRQSLKDAIKSAKESISAAAKVAEALSFVVKASTDSSTSLSSETGKCPVWKQRQDSQSPAPKLQHADSMRPGETAGNVLHQSPVHRSSAWIDAEAQHNRRSVQENIDTQPYRRHKKKRLSSLQQQLKDEAQEAKSSATTYIRNGSLQFNGRHVNACQNMCATGANIPATSLVIPRGSRRIGDSSPHYWDGASGINKNFTYKGKRSSDGTPHKPVVLKSPVVSPKITVQVTISNSPDLPPTPNVNYLVDQPVHRKENPTADMCLKGGHKRVDKHRSHSEFEQLSELALSKENWTVSHSCCSSARKTSSYLNDDIQVDYSSSTQRVYRRHKMNVYEDGSANNDRSECVKYNANVNRCHVSKNSNNTLPQISQHNKEGEKSKSFSTESPPLPPSRKQRTPGQRHESCNQECNQSELHQNSLTTPKKPKPSKGNLCLSRSYRKVDTITGQGKVDARYHGHSNRSYSEKVSKTRELSQDAQGKSPEISIPVCYSDPSSPSIFHQEFEDPYSNHCCEIKSLLETSNQLSKRKTRRISSINRQNDIQDISPSFAFSPNYYPDTRAGNGKAYLEYESEQGQTKVYVEIDPTLPVHGAKIQALQIPKAGVFPLSGPYSSSLGFSATNDNVLHGGDVKGNSPSWDNWPQHQSNPRASSKNVNNNNGSFYFGEVDTDDRTDDGGSGAGECLAIDNTIVNETVAESRSDLQPVGKQFSADMFVSNCYASQLWPILAVSEDITSRHACIIPWRSLCSLGVSAGGTENSTSYLRLKITTKPRVYWQEACSLMADCRAILGNNARTLAHLLRLYVTQKRNVAKQRLAIS
ncbi:hypothetical protein BsWGS_19248 [Bradybaena similaris]